MKDTTTEVYNQLKEILDENYFHIYVEETENKEVKWKVYFKNLTIEDYYSNENECLLSSEKNTIYDAYDLALKFLQEKENILKNQRIDIELKKADFSLLTLMLRDSMDFIISLLMCVGFIVSIIIYIFTCCKGVLLQNLIMILALLIANVVIDNKINKFRKEQRHKEIEDYIKTYIKGLGLKFVERIRIK